MLQQQRDQYADERGTAEQGRHHSDQRIGFQPHGPQIGRIDLAHHAIECKRHERQQHVDTPRVELNEPAAGAISSPAVMLSLSRCARNRTVGRLSRDGLAALLLMDVLNAPIPGPSTRRHDRKPRLNRERIADDSQGGQRRFAVARWPCAAMARGPHDAPWRGRVPSHRSSLRPRRAPAPARPSLLVPGVWSRNGDG